MVLKIGYATEHEQYSPTKLLDFTVLAEQYGFEAIWTSDHFHPWAHKGASGGFSWVWMAAAAERTKKVEVGTAVIAPTLRYNPAIVAQAFATLAVMYPNRIFIGLGTGEAMNEIPVGCEWPPFRERCERLEEAIKVMKLLWTKEFVNFKGKYYNLKKANLYTRPNKPIPIYVAASGPRSAEIAGKYADGFLTYSGLLRPRHLKEVLYPAIERGAKATGRDLKSIENALQVTVSYDEDFNKAVASCRFWAACLLPFTSKYPIYDPREIEAHGNMVDEKLLAERWLIATNPDEGIKKTEEYIKLGFTNIHYLSSSPDEEKFLKTFGERVLPYLKETYSESAG